MFASFLKIIKTHKIQEIIEIKIPEIKAFWKNEYCKISSIFIKKYIKFPLI